MWSTIHNVAEIIFGQSPPSSSYNKDGIGLPFFQGKAEFGDKYPVVEKWCNAPTREAQSGDILISIRAPVGPTNVADQHCAIGRGLAAIRPIIESGYVRFWLKKSEQKLVDKSTGTTFGAISKNVLNNHPIPVAPLNEQRRIVEKIERLFSRLDKGEEELRKTQRLLSLYRQSILKEAFAGRLVPQDPSDEPASDLLARIKKNHAAPTNIDSTMEEIELPQGWVSCQLGEVIPAARPKVPADPNSQLPFIGMDHIEPHSFHLVGQDEFAKMKSAGSYFQSGDILYGRLRPYLNKVHNAKFEGVASAEFIVFPASKFFESAFIKYLLHQRKFVEFAMSRSSGDRPRVKFNKITDFKFLLPPLNEQRRIVEKVESLFAQADKVEEEIRDAQKTIAHCRQSILKDAFAGKLVSQDPNDEPAAELLKRIRENPPRPKKNKTKKTQKAKK